MNAKIENILALRGDIPKDAAFPLPNHYKYACELIEDIKTQGDFSLALHVIQKVMWRQSIKKTILFI